MKLKVGTLFSGIGAPEEALSQEGITHEIAFACDNSPHVEATYRANHSPRVFFDDVTTIKPSDIPRIDLLVFGFPCQPFSMAGRGGCLKDARGLLIRHALRVLEHAKPSVVIAENVEGLVRRDGGAVLASILELFENAGYPLQHKVLNSLDFGSAQQRKRVWFVGGPKAKHFSYPSYNAKGSLSNVLGRDAADSDYATSSFLRKEVVRRRMAQYEHDHINCITQTIARRGSSSEYISYVAAVNRAIGEARRPTVDECLKLFGFSDRFAFPSSVSTTRRYEMLANSMSVEVLRAIFRNLYGQASPRSV